MIISEAMAAGKPIVATPAGGTADMVEDGKAGFIVSFDDAVALAAAPSAAPADLPHDFREAAGTLRLYQLDCGCDATIRLNPSVSMISGRRGNTRRG